MSVQPAAFMSYARFNDQHDNGRLTQFRERLSGEVQTQTGKEFPIFQDRKDIVWGQAWQQRINATLETVTLLIAIITPSFFESDACREEVERFLGREHKLGRQDLILPVYYVSTPELDEPARRDADRLARVLASRQFTDWRDLRFEPFTSPVVCKAIAQLASRMRDTFWYPTSNASTFTGEFEQTGGSKTEPIKQASTVVGMAKTEPPTHVVDPYERRDFASVSAAITAASPGDRILVRPGVYQENLVIDKPLEILGDGPVADIEIRACGVDVVLFKANIGRMANLTLRQICDGHQGSCVNITQGRLELEGCDLMSRGDACVIIRDAADPRIRRNRVHDSRSVGILIHRGGAGTLEDNEIAANANGGVHITSGGDPTLRRNTIRNDKYSGVFVYSDGLGTLDDNDINTNGQAGIEITAGGNPTLRNNRINHNALAGVWIYNGGQGAFEDNDLTDNGQGAWNITDALQSDVRRERNRE